MQRVIRDYLEVRDFASLDSLIERLTIIRDNLGPDADPEVKLRGDDHFGRHLSVAFKRPLTVEEANCEHRYNGETKLRAVA